MPQNRTRRDFAGRPVTSETNTSDWVFVRNRQQRGPNDSAGAWMTRDQRAQQHAEQQEAERFRASQANTGGASPAAGTSPITTVPIPLPPHPLPTAPAITPTPGSPTPDTPALPVPAWWNPNVYQNPTTEEQKFANVANALLPTLSPEDQRTLANYLAQNNRDVYGGYASANFDAAPTQITDALRSQFLSPQRAQQAVSLLDRMSQASGNQDMGAGYEYLRNAINLINQFTTDGVMTRERYGQFSNAVTSLNRNAGQGLSSYANLAQLFNLPSFSAGSLVSNTPNNRLYT